VASNIANIGKIAELRSRLLFTLLILALYRIGIFIAVPGVSRDVIADRMGGGGGFLGLFSMFSGGALEQFSIFALGVMPYISSSIIVQLLTVVVPALDRLKKEGDAGQKKINQYTRYGTVVLAVIQGLGLSAFIQGADTFGGSNPDAILQPGFWFTLVTVLTLTAGSMLLMWMGEQIQERGVGNGTSMIIFAGIVAQLPASTVQTISMTGEPGGLPFPLLVILGVVIVGVIGAICFFERGQRRIPVRYAKKVVGKQQYGGQNTYLPLKLNTAGVIPPIFASSLLMFPSMIAGLFPGSGVQDWLSQNLVMGTVLYNVLYIALIVFFCFFYTAVVFNPIDVADNMKKFGGFVPGIRAGKKTAEYIDRVLSRITLGGAVYISAVCILPLFLQTEFNIPFAFGGTGLLIVVGVALDTVQQIESHLISHNYEGFGGPGGQRLRGRRTRG
jgi:preprotein translocase subunit SecY